MDQRSEFQVFVEHPQQDAALETALAAPGQVALNLNAAGGCWPEPLSIHDVGRLSATAIMARGPFDWRVTHGGEYAAGNIASRVHCGRDDLYARSSGTAALEKMWELATLWVRHQEDERARQHLPPVRVISLLTTDEEYPAAVSTYRLGFADPLSPRVMKIHRLATEGWRTDERLGDLERAVRAWTDQLPLDSVAVVLLSHVQYRTGVHMPLHRLFRQIKGRLGERVLLMADCAQSFGHVPLSLEDMSADLAVFCPHKWIHAPTTGYLAVLNPHLRSLARRLGEFDDARDRGVAVAGTQNRTKFRQVAHAVDLYWDSRAFDRLRTLSAQIDSIGRTVRGIGVISPPQALQSASAIVSFRFPGLAPSDYYDLQRDLVERFNIVAGVAEGMPAWEGDLQAGTERAVLRFSPDYRLQAGQLDGLKNALEWARDRALTYAWH